MALNFPNTPTDGQQYTHEGRTWEWSESLGVWSLVPVSDNDAVVANAAAAQANLHRNFAEAAAVSAGQSADAAFVSKNQAAMSEATALASLPVQSATPPENPLPKVDWINTTNGKRYTNVGTTSSPVWVEVMAAVTVDNPALVSQLQGDLAADTGAALVGFKQAGVGAVARTVEDKAREWVSVRDFGAVGDGFTDDYPAIQKALDAAEGRELFINPGKYLLSSGSPQVRSNTIVRGAGKGRSILIQPNFYSYDRPTVPYNRSDVVDWNGMWCDVGTSNVHVVGIEFRGPFWQPDDIGYENNPVQNWPANNGFHVRGRDYQYRKGLPFEGESLNIQISRCHFEGWGEDGVQLDNVTGFRVEDNTYARNGRGGNRYIGCVDGWETRCEVRKLSPGDYLNNGNRMYGSEATRLYQSGCRPSENIWIYRNIYEDCLQWKCMGTHGGKRIRFHENTCINGHHGVGVDKGGFTVEHGISPPSDIEIIGNLFIRTAPGDPTEGNGEGGAGHAIFVTAHDWSEVHMGRNITIRDNVSIGWGCEALNGAMWLGRWKNVNLGPNTWIDSHGSAIRLRDGGANISVGTQIIQNVVRSAAGNHRGISVESGLISGVIAPCVFENSDPVNEMTAMFLPNNDGENGFSVQAGHRYSGLIRPVNIGRNDIDGPISLMPSAAGYCLVSDGTLTVQSANGVESVTREGVGVYLINLKRPATSAENMIVSLGIVQTSRSASWERVSLSSFRVRVFGAGTTTPADNSFSFMAIVF